MIHADGDGAAFFEKPFITQGMQDLVTEGVARFAGVSNQTFFYSNQNQRDRVAGLADYLAKKVEAIHPEEATAARVLREMVKNQRLR